MLNIIRDAESKSYVKKLGHSHGSEGAVKGWTHSYIFNKIFDVAYHCDRQKQRHTITLNNNTAKKCAKN